MATVRIPDRLYMEIEERVKESGEFESVEEYVTFVLEELLKDEEEEEYSLSEEDEEKVKERLRGLGYL
jgi:Arc/MetJ-type ribon-helix-helix transcriptional regulator